MSVYGYVRVSTSAQADSGLGLDAQRAEIYAYALERGLIVEGIYEDAGVSGSKDLGKRPEGRRLEEDLETGDAVILRLDRGFRSAANCLTTVDAWHRSGIVVHLIDLELDTSTPMGEFVLGVFAGLAQLERRLISERTKRALHQRRVKGLSCNGKAPYGFRIGPEGRLVIEPDEAIHAGRAWYLRDTTGLSWQRIAAEAEDWGWTRRSGLPWTRQALRGALAEYTQRYPERRRQLRRYYEENGLNRGWD